MRPTGSEEGTQTELDASFTNISTLSLIIKAVTNKEEKKGGWCQKE